MSFTLDLDHTYVCLFTDDSLLIVYRPKFVTVHFSNLEFREIVTCCDVIDFSVVNTDFPAAVKNNFTVKMRFKQVNILQFQFPKAECIIFLCHFYSSFNKTVF